MLGDKIFHVSALACAGVVVVVVPRSRSQVPLSLSSLSPTTLSCVNGKEKCDERIERLCGRGQASVNPGWESRPLQIRLHSRNPSLAMVESRPCACQIFLDGLHYWYLIQKRRMSPFSTFMTKIQMDWKWNKKVQHWHGVNFWLVGFVVSRPDH